MYQFIGGLLALASVISAVVASPLSGTFFALLTLAWVMFAKPASPVRQIRYDGPRGRRCQGPIAC